MMKKYLLVIFLLFLPTIVKAGCSDDDLIRLQRLTNNISVMYSYDKYKDNFTVTFTNVSSELVITDIDSNKDYKKSGELNIYDVKPGSHSYYIYVYDKNCYDNELGTKTINIPYYNKYYQNEECEGISNYKYCSRWLPNDISYKDWYSNVIKYKESIKKEQKSKEKENKNKTILDIIKELFVDLYVTYYYVFLPITILALCAIIYLKNKSEQLI